MRILIALVAVLYLIAAVYGYFWWNNRQAEAQTSFTQANSTVTSHHSSEQLSFSDIKPMAVDNSQLIVQQLEQMKASFVAQLKQLESKQDEHLKALQKQIDELKQAQLSTKTQTQAQALEAISSSAQAMTSTTNTESTAPPTEQLLAAQVNKATQRLKASVSQLDLNLQAATPDLARQSILQQKLEDVFNQAELTQVIQSRTECGQVFCKLDLQGKAPEGVDVLQTLWEQQVFPEATEVLTIPKADGSGWVVYVARDGQSLPTIP